MLRVTPQLGAQFSRHELVRSPHVWFALCATFATFTVAVAILALVMPGVNPTRMFTLAGLLGIATVFLSVSQAPQPDTIQAHLLLALIYVGPAIAIWGFSPTGSAVVASAMFIGPLVSMWTTRRSHQLLHLGAATIALFLPSALGFTDTATLVACAALVPAILVLSFCVSVVLEGSERQGVRLAHLMRRDPLTGLGNRRLMNERIAESIATADRTRRTFAILTLDLNGFKTLNDTLGHAAGDDLLRDVAHALHHATPGDATLVRQGGDEFAVILPGAQTSDAARAASQISAALSSITAAGHSGAVSSGVGSAVFPDDARSATALLDIADDRLRAAKTGRPAAAQAALLARAAADARARGPREASRHPVAVRSKAPPRHLGREAAAAADAALLEHSDFDDGLGRRDMEDNLLVWRANAAMYLIYAVLGAGVIAWAPELTGPWFGFVVAFGGLVGIVFLIDGPPRLTDRANHVVIAMAYVIPALILITCQPGGSVAIGCLIFVGPLAATRLTDRRLIAAHLGVASAILLGLAPTGLLDAATIVSVLILVGAMWVLGVCCVIVLEAAEAQTGQLRELVGHDPLTGVGNRRSLDALLARELRRRSGRDSLTLLAFDFNGFKALNDTVGHAAGDALLIAAATALEAEAAADEHVFRQGGDEFLIVCSASDATGGRDRAAAFRAALATVDCNGQPLTTGIGIASAPHDGTTPTSLLAAADLRLLTDKRRSAIPSAVSPHDAAAA